MQFTIGDEVVHPAHGAGRITGVEHQELVAGFKHYYVVKILHKELTVFVPMRKAEELGMRSIMGQTELTRVLDTLSSTPRELPDNHRERQERIREKLRPAYPIAVAEAVRDLTQHQELKNLTTADSRLLNQGRQLLAVELALVTGTSVAEANETIDVALADATASELQ